MMIPVKCLNLFFALLIAAVSAFAERPNIIVILSDDVGYSDLGCYGGEIRTPNLDALAAGGLRFTQFYNTGRCCPTRASLLTGLYPHQAGIGHMMMDDELPGYRGDLGKDAVTIAEVLKEAGYKNYLSGKWHVTPILPGEAMLDSPRHNWPLKRGFDRFYGTINGAGSFYDPNSLVRDDSFISPYADPEYQPESFYYTDAISDHAVRFINEHDSSSPFFMYVAYTAAHWPMHAPEDEINKYDGVYDEGYGPIREARYKRMLELGVIDMSAKLSPQEWKWGHVKNKAWEVRNMETYAAMLTIMDAGIGRIIDALKANGQYENTLVLYLQDNGACQETYGRKIRKGDKIRAEGPRPAHAPLPPMDPAELQTNMIPDQTRDGYRIRMGEGAMPGPADTYIAYGMGWANVSNTPFRMYKQFNHEGGISTPLIAHWPSGIQVRNELRHSPTHLIDIMPTCVALAQANYPEERSGVSIQPMEGQSLLPVFDNDELPERTLFFEHQSHAALRQGDWKLVAKNVMLKNSTRTSNWELYHIAEDRSELINLAEEKPERLQEMIKDFEAKARQTRAFPSKYGASSK